MQRLRDLLSLAWYRAMQAFCRVVTLLLFRVRCQGAAVVPAHGATMLLCNHQSHLDPILIGSVCRRRMQYLARSSLYRFAPLGWLIQSLGGISIDRDAGIGGLKATMRLLKDEKIVLMFPEGTRTPDGQMQPLKGGFGTIAKRTSCTIVPVGLDGAYDAWPRTRGYPLPGKICIEFGQPLEKEEVERLSEDELLLEVERRIQACIALARARRLGKVQTQ